MLLHNCKREIAKLNSNNVIIFFPNFKNLPMQLQSEGYCVDLKKKKNKLLAIKTLIRKTHTNKHNKSLLQN